MKAAKEFLESVHLMHFVIASLVALVPLVFQMRKKLYQLCLKFLSSKKLSNAPVDSLTLLPLASGFVLLLTCYIIFPASSSMNDGDHKPELYMIVATILVYFMQIGFIAFEAGEVHRSYRIVSAVKNLLVFIISFGSYISFGPIIQAALGNQVAAHQSSLGMAFNAGFASTVSLIIANTLAERATIGTNLALAFVAAGIGYPTLSGLMWNGGVLYSRGFVDVAGAGVVHLFAGIMGLYSAFMVGPSFRTQLWRFLDCPRRPDQRSLMPLTVMGGLFLWFGWLGFNSGNAANTHEFIEAFLNTSIGACGGAIASIANFMLMRTFHSWQTAKKMKTAVREAMSGKKNPQLWQVVPSQMRVPVREMLDLGRISIGMLGGLVTVTANASLVHHSGAFIESLFGGAIAIWGSSLITARAKRLDDRLGAIATHAGSGCFGLLITPVFVSTGWAELGNRFVIQLEGCAVCVIVGFTLGMSVCCAIWILEQLSLSAVGISPFRIIRLRVNSHSQATGQGLDFGPCPPVRGSERQVELMLEAHRWDNDVVAEYLILECREPSPTIFDGITGILKEATPARFATYRKRERLALIAVVCLGEGNDSLDFLCICLQLAVLKPRTHAQPHPKRQAQRDILYAKYRAVLVWTMSYLAEDISLANRVVDDSGMKLKTRVDLFLKALAFLRDVREDLKENREVRDLARVGILALEGSALYSMISYAYDNPAGQALK